MDNQIEAQCGHCKDKTIWSRPLILVLVFAPTLSKPYPLIADGEYVYCISGDCHGPLNIAQKAIDAHVVTRPVASTWTRALIIDAAGKGQNVVPHRNIAQA